MTCDALYKAKSYRLKHGHNSPNTTESIFSFTRLYISIKSKADTIIFSPFSRIHIF